MNRRPYSRTAAARREREKGQVLGTAIQRSALVALVEGLQGQPADGFALGQQPQGQDERKAMAEELKHMPWRRSLWIWNAPALRRGDKGNHETTKKRRRQSSRRRPGGSKWRELGEEGIGVTACAWVHFFGGATRRAGGEPAGAFIW